MPKKVFNSATHSCGWAFQSVDRRVPKEPEMPPPRAQESLLLRWGGYVACLDACRTVGKLSWHRGPRSSSSMGQRMVRVPSCPPPPPAPAACSDPAAEMHVVQGKAGHQQGHAVFIGVLFETIDDCLQAPWAGQKKRPFPETLCRDDKSGRGSGLHPRAVFCNKPSPCRPVCTWLHGQRWQHVAGRSRLGPCPYQGQGKWW